MAVKPPADTFADLLKARGDVPIATLRQIKTIVDGLLELVDTMDTAFDLPPAPTEAEQAIAAALRARYPVFPDKDGRDTDATQLTDAEILAYFGVKLEK